MEIVGDGFLARHLRPLASRHDGMVALAAGVSWASGTSAAAFDREAALLSRVAARCRASGHRLLFFSTASAGVYGASRPGRESDKVTGRNPYGAHKLARERELLESGADYLILRLGHLVGPGQPSHQLIPTLVRQLQAGAVQIYPGATRDLIDVRDVVAIIDALLNGGVHRQIVNVASGVAVPVEDIVGHLEQRLGVTARRDFSAAGNGHLVCTRKLRLMVPEVTAIGFGPGYYQRVLDAFVCEQKGLTYASRQLKARAASA